MTLTNTVKGHIADTSIESGKRWRLNQVYCQRKFKEILPASDIFEVFYPTVQGGSRPCLWQKKKKKELLLYPPQQNPEQCHQTMSGHPERVTMKYLIPKPLEDSSRARAISMHEMLERMKGLYIYIYMDVWVHIVFCSLLSLHLTTDVRVFMCLALIFRGGISYSCILFSQLAADYRTDEDQRTRGALSIVAVTTTPFLWTTSKCQSPSSTLLSASLCVVTFTLPRKKTCVFA